jgi:hypothetical protein
MGNNMTQIDMSKIVEKYGKYLKRKTEKGETPMKPESWLWHNLDRFNVDKITKGN